jgi:hypothetical protein
MPHVESFAELWRKNCGLYSDDIALFLEDQWIVRDAPPNMTLGPLNQIRLLPHQREILRFMFQRDSNGAFLFDLMIYSTIKKSGKTEIEGGVGEWVSLVEAGTPEVFWIGNDKEQAQTRAFAAVGMQVNPKSKAYNPVIAEFIQAPLRFTKSTDYMPVAGGGFHKCIPVDYSGEAGANPLASLWDELWGVDREAQQRLWDEFTPPPTRKNSFRFVATYAGFKNESKLLYELYKRVVGGDRASERKKRRVHPTLPIYVSPDGRAVAYWDDGEEARRMPWQTPIYYTGQKNALRKEAYERLHLNKWVSAETRFVTEAVYDSMPDYTREMGTENESKYPVYIGIDAAHKRDSCAVTAVEYLPIYGPNGRPMKRLVDHAIWTPTSSEVVLPEDTIVPWVEAWIAKGTVRAIGYDPAHFETPAILLRRKYPQIEFVEVTPSIAHLTSLGCALQDDFNYKTLVLYHAPDLRQHILNAGALETSAGIRLVKGGKQAEKMDGAISLSISSWLANRKGPTDFRRGPVVYILTGEEGDDFDSEIL